MLTGTPQRSLSTHLYQQSWTFVTLSCEARILTGHSIYNHITPVLKSLHWLPVHQRIQFKILVIVFKAVNHTAPVFMQELVNLRKTPKALRSADQLVFEVPFSSSAKAKSQTFSIAGPALWNSIPVYIRLASSLSVFKSKLKTQLFSCAYQC